MYSHPKLREFEDRMARLFVEVDHRLEDAWGDRFAVHPNRPHRGATADPGMDGLFEIAPDFTAGIGSERGRGYLISLRVATLERVPPEKYEAFLEEAASFVRTLLPKYFPGRDLRVVRDGRGFKIIGDFSLGAV